MMVCDYCGSMTDGEKWIGLDYLGNYEVLMFCTKCESCIKLLYRSRQTGLGEFFDEAFEKEVLFNA